VQSITNCATEQAATENGTMSASTAEGAIFNGFYSFAQNNL
jgi:hypothetical protein